MGKYACEHVSFSGQHYLHRWIGFKGCDKDNVYSPTLHFNPILTVDSIHFICFVFKNNNLQVFANIQLIKKISLFSKEGICRYLSENCIYNTCQKSLGHFQKIMKTLWLSQHINHYALSALPFPLKQC